MKRTFELCHSFAPACAASQTAAGRPAGPQRPARVLELFTPLGSALSAAHAARIIHRDIKPTNVMIELGTERVVLLDFGVAKVLDGTPITGVPSSLPNIRRLPGSTGMPR